MQIPVNEYHGRIGFKNKQTISLLLNKYKSKEKFEAEITVPKKMLENVGSDFVITADQIKQKFDLVGKIHSETTYEDTQCSTNYCATDPEAGPLCQESSYPCTITTTEEDLELQFVHPNTSSVIAVFKGTYTTVYESSNVSTGGFPNNDNGHGFPNFP